MTLIRNIGGLLFGVWALATAIAGGFVFGTLLALPFVVLPRGRRERYTMLAALVWSRFTLAVGLAVRTDVTGTLDLGQGEGALLFCNHRSWLDPILLIANTRSNGLSKKEILYIPFVGLYGWLTGAVFFDRRSQRQRERARDEVLMLVESGHRVQVFPEGTRTRDGKLRDKVYLRLAADCWSRNIPVACCAVMDTERVLPVGRPFAWPLQRVRLHLGPTLRPTDYADRDVFAHACWDVVKELVAELEQPAASLPKSA